jgi:hypothetical protein
VAVEAKAEVVGVAEVAVVGVAVVAAVARP